MNGHAESKESKVRRIVILFSIKITCYVCVFEFYALFVCIDRSSTK